MRFSNEPRFIANDRRPLVKDGLTPKKRRAQRARRLDTAERSNKGLVRERDGRCRFPQCGCSIGWHGPKSVLTISHDAHKGMGGDPTGERSLPDVLLLMCRWRHQTGRVSIHAGTLRTTYLSEQKSAGPLAFLVDLAALYPGLYSHRGVWMEVAREIALGVLDTVTLDQQRVLDDLKEMER